MYPAEEQLQETGECVNQTVDGPAITTVSTRTPPSLTLSPDTYTFPGATPANPNTFPSLPHPHSHTQLCSVFLQFYFY